MTTRRTREELVDALYEAEREAYGLLPVTMPLSSAQAWADTITNHQAVIAKLSRIVVVLTPLEEIPPVNEGMSIRGTSEIQLTEDGCNIRTLMHELSHQYTDKRVMLPNAHSKRFLQTHGALAEAFLGKDFAAHLRACYKIHRVWL